LGLAAVVGATDALSFVGDRRRHQASFPEASERFRTSHADSPVGLALLTPSGDVFHANPALCRLLASDEADLVGRPFTTYVHPEDRAQAGEAVRPVADDSLRSDSLRLLVGQGGCCWVSTTVRTVLARSGEPLLLVVHVEDRTAEVEAMVALGHVERVALAGRLAGGVIHDVRNALAALQGRVELLAADLEDPGAARTHLESMHSAMDRITALTRQVLDLVRPTARSQELVDLAGIVAAFEAVARTQFADPGRVAICIGGPALVVADPADLERVLLTLFSNAVDAVEDGGSVRITVDTTAAPVGSGAGPRAQLVVEDTGIGMDDETSARACEPFFSTKGDAGVGLGMASAESVVLALGGTLSIDSAPGRGTRVEVDLPAVPISDDD
jgi:PAS domain S-box-containing protein